MPFSPDKIVEIVAGIKSKSKPTVYKLGKEHFAKSTWKGAFIKFVGQFPPFKTIESLRKARLSLLSIILLRLEELITVKTATILFYKVLKVAKKENK